VVFTLKIQRKILTIRLFTNLSVTFIGTGLQIKNYFFFIFLGVLVFTAVAFFSCKQ